MINKLSKFIFIIFIIIGCINYLKVIKNIHDNSLIKNYEFINPFFKISGINESIPQVVIEIQSLATQNKLNNFNLSRGLKDNVYLLQRSVEFLYPLRITNNSNYIFALSGEAINNDCKLIESRNEISLYKCQ